MKVFGLGSLASMANEDRYLRFTKSMYGVYSTMENEMDKCSVHSGTPVAYFWKRHSEILRRADLLRGD